MRYPIAEPARIPQMTARGKAVAGVPKETPPIKTTASRPSLRVVMKGRTAIAYF